MPHVHTCWYPSCTEPLDAAPSIDVEALAEYMADRLIPGAYYSREHVVGAIREYARLTESAPQRECQCWSCSHPDGGPCVTCGGADHAQPAAPETEYHEHVAGDKHSHAFTGPHSHGGVSALAQPAAPETCPICGWITSHDHCTECQARNAMPWTHVETCARYRPATDFDTDDARAFLERAAAQPAAPETERLRDDRRWMEHTNDCSRSREGVYSKGCTCGAEVVGRLPIYCTGDCDACRDYARELGVPLVVPAAPETERLREALAKASRTLHDLCSHEGRFEDCPWAECVEPRAAIEAGDTE